MFQLDLFTARTKPAPATEPASKALDLPGLLKRLTDVCERPRYSYMVLNLIAQAAVPTGSAGPYVREGERLIPIRDWLCDALIPVAQHNSRREVVTERARNHLIARGLMSASSSDSARLVEKEVTRRLRHSGLTNVSRAVSELVRAGFVRRHYQGYRVDHHNRGAQRQAVYEITDEALGALR